MNFKTKLIREVCAADKHFDFGVTDNKGRAVGTCLVRSTETYVPAADDAVSYFTISPGTHFVWYLHATRDGERYGSSHRRHFCDTLPQRTKEAAACLTARKARAVKKWKKTKTE